MLHLFVSEYISGGAWPDLDLPRSLADEGLAMLRAFAGDAALLSDVTVTTTCAVGLDLELPGVRIVAVESPEQERFEFARLAAECDATFVIAPEFNNILAARCRLVESLGGRLVGPGSTAVELCGDKLRLAEHFLASRIRTIETQLFDFDQAVRPEFPYPIVIKPRDGAGSQGTYLLRTPLELESLRQFLLDEPLLKRAICQPYVPGRACSVALLRPEAGEPAAPLIPCEQILSSDGRFHYEGGVVPARVADPEPLLRAARAAVDSVPQLQGYVGVDLILPDAGAPIVVEINPRLTTSYLGYRELSHDNLVERILFPERTRGAVRWRAGQWTFTPRGVRRMNDEG